MSSETGQERSKRRSAGGRNKLRRFNNIESVIVEEPFRLSVPTETPSSLKIEAGIKEGDIAGDGYYVSATNNSSRYYGLLVSKEALKAASILHFHAESESLDLNRRMKLLKERQESTVDTDRGDSAEHVAKRQKVDDNGSVPACIGTDSLVVQKFQYVPSANDTDPGYRILIATYVNVAAAAEGDSSRAEAISKACNAGGAFVGEYYYKHESVVQNPISEGE
ncbi:hypothetical protein MHU86_8711 [Fragilaria crotonensis]|nr:hypothetical protein MHU86_8711 [Fragilaria crotonensis]